MDTIYSEICSESVDELFSLLGLKIQVVYSPRFLVTHSSSALESSSFSILLQNNRYLNLNCQWLETPINAFDYYQIVTSISTKPAEISTKINKGSEEPVFPVSLFSFENSNELKSISIYQEVVDLEEETLIYDKALLLNRKDGKRICFLSSDPAFRNLVLVHDHDQIDEKIASLTCRKNRSI